jgi:hypothetical protein
MSVFTYYAALSITGVFHLHLNQYTQCLEVGLYKLANPVHS